MEQRLDSITTSVLYCLLLVGSEVLPKRQKLINVENNLIFDEALAFLLQFQLFAVRQLTFQYCM